MLPPLVPYRVKMNNPFNAGIADVWYSGEHSDLWVEYKYLPKLPSRTAVKLNLSALQSKWLHDRYTEGRNIAVVLGHPGGGVLFRDLEWECDFSKDEILCRTLSKKQIASALFGELTGKTL
jgi:hypothetical protein